MHHRSLSASRLLALAMLPACAAAPFDKLPTFDNAMHLAQPDEPRRPILFERELPTKLIRELVPYGISAGASSSKDAVSCNAWMDAVPWMPDAVLVLRPESETSVGPAFHIYGGISYVSSSTTHSAAAVLFRQPPAMLPFVFDDRGFISAVDNEATKTAGVIEGDTLVAVEGAELTRSPASPHFLRMLEMTAGQPVKVEVIRPGIGRRTLTVTAAANGGTFATDATAVSTKRFPGEVVADPQEHRWRIRREESAESGWIHTGG